MIEVLQAALDVSRISLVLLGAGIGIIAVGLGFTILTLMEARR